MIIGKKKCIKILDDLSINSDGQLSFSLKQKDHISVCSSCRDLYDTLQTEPSIDFSSCESSVMRKIKTMEVYKQRHCLANLLRKLKISRALYFLMYKRIANVSVGLSAIIIVMCITVLVNWFYFGKPLDPFMAAISDRTGSELGTGGKSIGPNGGPDSEGPYLDSPRSSPNTATKTVSTDSFSGNIQENGIFSVTTCASNNYNIKESRRENPAELIVMVSDSCYVGNSAGNVKALGPVSESKFGYELNHGMFTLDLSSVCDVSQTFTTHARSLFEDAIIKVQEDNPNQKKPFLVRTYFDPERWMLCQLTGVASVYIRRSNFERWVPYQLAGVADVVFGIYTDSGQLVRTIQFNRANLLLRIGVEVAGGKLPNTFFAMDSEKH